MHEYLKKPNQVGRKIFQSSFLITAEQWRAAGVSGQPGADARVDVEDLRAGGEFVTILHQVMEARTVVGN